MNKTFELIKALIAENDVLVSVHGYEELAEDNLYVSDIVNNALAGLVIEDYPEYHKGACGSGVAKRRYQSSCAKRTNFPANICN